MPTLSIFGKEIETVFQLIGEKENDISRAVGWAMTQCPKLLELFLQQVFDDSLELDEEDLKTIVIQQQTYEGGKGFTDFEIGLAGKFYLIVEAKRGWVLPTINQLEKYAIRSPLLSKDFPQKRLVTLTECSPEYVHAHFNNEQVSGVPVKHLSWKDIFYLAKETHSLVGHAEKRIIWQLNNYLKKIMSIQNKESNWVYVVSLASGNPEGWDISWQDIVNVRRHYFHRIGNNWPAQPPNYIAFRYNGRLQSIHHIERYEVFKNPIDKFEEAQSEVWEDHFLYYLGSPIIPPHEIKNGKVYPSGRYWCMLDTLLTANTVSEARDISKTRMEAV